MQFSYWAQDKKISSWEKKTSIKKKYAKYQPTSLVCWATFDYGLSNLHPMRLALEFSPQTILRRHLYGHWTDTDLRRTKDLDNYAMFLLLKDALPWLPSRTLSCYDEATNSCNRTNIRADVPFFSLRWLF